MSYILKNLHTLIARHVDELTEKTNPHPRRIRLKFMYHLRIMRGGSVAYEVKRKRDLLVWRGQSVLARLLSQGAVGTATAAWYVIASSNSTSPSMGDDSGDPEANEFSPQIGTKVAVSYGFEPTTKPTSEYQTPAQINVSGTISVTATATLRKIGIIDNVATPNRNIIVEDAVVPIAVYNGDSIEIKYSSYLG